MSEEKKDKKVEEKSKSKDIAADLIGKAKGLGIKVVGVVKSIDVPSILCKAKGLFSSASSKCSKAKNEDESKDLDKTKKG